MIDDIKKVAGVVDAVVKVAKAVGGTEDGKQAVEELGKTALTVTRLVNNALLPLAAVNYGFDKAKQYFKEQFPEDMQARVKEIPEEQLVAPKPSIAGQALQGLAYSHEEIELKNLYLGLLAKAMDKRTASSTHPAFVEIIRQLSAQEIEILTKTLAFETDLAIVEIHLVEPDRTYRTLRRHILDLRNVVTQSPVETPKIEMYVANWRRLGLVEVDYTKHLNPAAEVYGPFDSRPEFIEAKQKNETETSKVVLERGILHRTQFGRDFARAVGMLDPILPSASRTAA